MTRQEFCKSISEKLQRISPTSKITYEYNRLDNLYEIRIKWNDWNCLLTEKAYDKFYLPFNHFDNHDAIDYTDREVDLAVHNLKYAILSCLNNDIFVK